MGRQLEREWEMVHDKNCNCGQCRLIRGEAIAGNCVICKNPGMFTSDDIILVGGFELFAHFDCRIQRARIHDLERELS